MKKVLLPIDGSKRSIHTVETVKKLCTPGDCEIYIVKVVSARLYLHSMEEIKEHAELALPELESIAALLPGYTTHVQVLLGSSPGVEIVEFAKEIGADMLMMTRSSRGPIRKMGSVAAHIVKNADFLDLVVLREQEED